MPSLQLRRRALGVAAVVRARLQDPPYGYPPMVMTISEVAMALLAIVAITQRGFQPISLIAVAAGLAAFCPSPMYLFTGLHPPAWMLCVTCTVAQLLFFYEPVTWDLSPFILVLGAGEIAAIASWRVSVPATALFLAVVAYGGISGALVGSPMYATGVLLGWMVGVIVAMQLRVLEQERAGQAERSEQAAAEERRRIAREVHDVVAHSLSVTLLQVTGARMALQQDADIPEALAALRDAERVGRQAMSDIRRTVGLLGSGPSATAPEPTLADIDNLVADFRGAGLRVHYDRTGDTAAVSAATGLCLYRIVQESLTNVVKHAAGAKVAVTVSVTATEAIAIVANTAIRPVEAAPGHGFGIAGMRQRAELLGGHFAAGPARTGWEVSARVPLPVAGLPCLGRVAAAPGGLAGKDAP